MSASRLAHYSDHLLALHSAARSIARERGQEDEKTVDGIFTRLRREAFLEATETFRKMAVEVLQLAPPSVAAAWTMAEVILLAPEEDPSVRQILDNIAKSIQYEARRWHIPEESAVQPEAPHK